MSNIKKQVAVADAGVGVNIIATEEKRVQSYDRIIMGYGCTGSAAIADTILDVRVGGRTWATFINTATGLGLTRDHILADRILVPADAQVEVVVTDAPVTNAIMVEIKFLP